MSCKDTDDQEASALLLLESFCKAKPGFLTLCKSCILDFDDVFWVDEVLSQESLFRKRAVVECKWHIDVSLFVSIYVAILLLGVQLIPVRELDSLLVITQPFDYQLDSLLALQALLTEDETATAFFDAGFIFTLPAPDKL